MMRAAGVLAFSLVTIASIARAQSRDGLDAPIDSALSELALRVESRSPAAPADSLTPAQEPGLAGIGFAGALAWYPGALAGLASGAAHGGGGAPHWVVAIAVAGGGASTGLVIGLLTASKRGCDPVRAVAKAVLGAEIGSFAGAAATGAFAVGLFGGGGLAVVAAPVVVPLASALGAVALVRRCR